MDSSDNPNKRIKFTSDNIDEYEKQFMLEHDRAMGYAPRLPQPESCDIRQVALRELAPPTTLSPFMESFRAWIKRNQLARFNCFQEPSWDCPCYKCETWRKQREEDTTMMEGILERQQWAAVVNNPYPQLIVTHHGANAVSASTDSTVFHGRFSSVSHFYEDLPKDDGETPSTPKFSFVDYPMPDSDQGKEKAQQKWIMLMQMTPTRLVF